MQYLLLNILLYNIHNAKKEQRRTTFFKRVYFVCFMCSLDLKMNKK